MSVFSYNNSDAENASGDIKNVISEIEGTLTDMDGLADLIAYNVSDVVGLGALFERNAYATQFDLKLGLMRTYPQTTLTRDGLTLVEASRPDANERESEER